MSHRIAHAIASLPRLWSRAPSRPETAEVHQPICAHAHAHTPASPRRPLPARRSRHHEPVVPGEDTALVRPYLIAHERREEARLQEERRLALWLAVQGVDIGPRFIHGVEVAV